MNMTTIISINDPSHESNWADGYNFRCSRIRCQYYFKADKLNMRNKLIIQSVILVGMVFISVISCTYEEVLPYQPDPGVDVLFGADIIPIFEGNCTASGCHNGSGPAPDLRSSVAYDALWMGGYINTETPEQSNLYLWMTDAFGPMPPQGGNATNNANVLQWIKQGALNN